MDWILVLEKGPWFGLAAVGFAILFNVPVRTLLLIFIVGALGGLMKTFLFSAGVSVLISSFGGAVLVGILTIFAAYKGDAPPLVFAIPGVIPMVPGVFANKTMLGVLKLSFIPGDLYLQILTETIYNGLNTVLVLLALAIGVTLPLLIFRKESIKKLPR